MSLSQDDRQYLIYSISSCPCSPLNITICTLLILFAVVKNRLQRILQALAVRPQLSTNQPTNSFYLDRTVVLMVLDDFFFFFFPLPRPTSHSCSNAGWHADPFDSCPLWSDAWQAATELVVWVSWRVAAPWQKPRTGNRCWGGGRQDTAGPVRDMGYRLDPRGMDSGEARKG